METFILKDISLSGWAFGDSNDVLDILAGDNWILNDFFAIWKEVSYLNNIRIVCFWEHDWYLVTSLFVFLILCIVFLKIYLFLGLFISGAQLSGAQFATFGGRTVGPRTTGPRGPTVRGPICHFWGADNWAPDNWAPSSFSIFDNIFDDWRILFVIKYGISMFGMVHIVFLMFHLGLGWSILYSGCFIWHRG